MSRSKMTELRNGRLKGFTIDCLFSLLGKLDHHIEIRVRPKLSHKTEKTIEDIVEAERELDAGGGKTWSLIKEEIGL